MRAHRRLCYEFFVFTGAGGVQGGWAKRCFPDGGHSMRVGALLRHQPSHRGNGGASAHAYVAIRPPFRDGSGAVCDFPGTASCASSHASSIPAGTGAGAGAGCFPPFSLVLVHFIRVVSVILQTTTYDPKELEPEFHDLKDSRGQPVRSLFANKGL